MKIIFETKHMVFPCPLLMFNCMSKATVQIQLRVDPYYTCTIIINTRYANSKWSAMVYKVHTWN